MASTVNTPDVLKDKMSVEKIADLQKHIDAEILGLKQEIEDYARQAMDLGKFKHHMSLAQGDSCIEIGVDVEHDFRGMDSDDVMAKAKMVEQDNKDAQTQAERRMKECLKIQHEVGCPDSELYEWCAANAKELDKLAMPDLLKAIKHHNKLEYQARIVGYRERKMERMAEDYKDLNTQIDDAHHLQRAAGVDRYGILEGKIDALRAEAALAQYRIDRMNSGYPYLFLGNSNGEEPVEE
ncbi:hypothetical protein N3K66_003450 [Trichothecium roseum]|uniref:Uncharacterized protein n=1 Tax=Trichothecium roseum TaxID=47278 RepID=A0ACC0V5Z7_9HYPO|nr:hypothetical protein N3K66_003450 [Trichothecium roseum]